MPLPGVVPAMELVPVRQGFSFIGNDVLQLCHIGSLKVYYLQKIRVLIREK